MPCGTYSGALHEDLQQFEKSFNRAAGANFWSGDVKLGQLGNALTGSVKKYFDRNNFTSSEEVFTNLKTYFGGGIAKDLALKQLRTRVQQQNESPSDYAQEMLSLCAKAGTSLSEEEKCYWVIDGLNLETYTWVRHAARNIKNIEDLMKAVREAEMILAHGRARNQLQSCAAVSTGPHSSEISRLREDNAALTLQLQELQKAAENLGTSLRTFTFK